MVPVVRAEQLTKDFSVGFWRRRPHRALDHLSFEIAEGGVFGLLGPNGAGKTTTIKLLINLLWPTAGSVSLFGRPPGDPDVRARIGFLAEHPTFYDQLTAEEVVSYFAGLFGLRGAERRTRVGRVLDRVGLDEARRRPLRQYSKGMLQRVGLAQAIVNDPALLILDEPMSGLDPIGRREVRDLILELRDEGRTILFSSHILSDAEALCSHVAILARGSLKAAGSVRDLTSRGRRGWEIIVSGLADAAADRFRSGAQRLTRIADERYAIEIGHDTSPERLIADLSAAGASLVSATPMTATLEDVFLEQVAQ